MTWRTPVAPSHRADRAQGRERGREERYAALLGHIPGGLLLQDTVLHAWSASYTTGGEAVEEPVVGSGTIYGEAVGRLGYTFDYTGGNLLAYDNAGAEVAATTDLSVVLGTMPVHFYGAAAQERQAFVAPGRIALERLRIRVSKTITYDGTNDWTMDVVTYDPDGNRTKRLTFTAATRTLTAATWLTIYTPAGGLDLPLGSSLSLKLVPVGTPATLQDFTVETTYRRKVG